MTASLYIFLPPEQHVHPIETYFFQVYSPLGPAVLQECRQSFRQMSNLCYLPFASTLHMNYTMCQEHPKLPQHTYKHNLHT
jgi:hypothetical protein